MEYRKDLFKFGRYKIACYNGNEKQKEAFAKSLDSNLRPFASFLYSKKEVIPDIEKRAEETYDLLKRMMQNIGYSEKEIKDFFKNYYSILTKSKDEIITRFALFKYAGIDEDVLLSESPILLWQYTEEKIYLAITRMQKDGIKIDCKTIREHTFAPESEALKHQITDKVIKKLTQIYSMRRDL